MHAGGQYLLRFTVRQMFFRLCYRVRISGCGGVGLRGIHSGAGGGEVRSLPNRKDTVAFRDRFLLFICMDTE